MYMNACQSFAHLSLCFQLHADLQTPTRGPTYEYIWRIGEFAFFETCPRDSKYPAINYRNCISVFPIFFIPDSNSFFLFFSFFIRDTVLANNWHCYKRYREKRTFYTYVVEIRWLNVENRVFRMERKRLNECLDKDISSFTNESSCLSTKFILSFTVWCFMKVFAINILQLLYTYSFMFLSNSVNVIMKFVSCRISYKVPFTRHISTTKRLS